MINRYLHLITSKIPESGFKEVLRKVYFKHYNSLYPLNHLIKEIKRSDGGDDEILVELVNGIRFFTPVNEYKPGAYGIGKEHREFKYGDPQKLDKLNQINIEYFAEFFSILRSIFVMNIYEKDYSFQPGDTVLDLGANIGIFAVKAGKQVGKRGKVIAIEPDPHNLSYLERNLEINEIKNCVIVPKGVWSKKGELNLYLGPGGGCNSLVWKREKLVSVKVDTLSGILDKIKVDNVNFIKMDIEGAEIEALEGMENILKEHDVTLAIEAFHVVNNQPSSVVILPRLRKLGYKAYERDGFVYARRESCLKI